MAPLDLGLIIEDKPSELSQHTCVMIFIVFLYSLLHIGVTLLQEKLVTSTLERTLLRERIYNSTLDYFSFDLCWPNESSVMVREAVATLIKFWQSIKELKNVDVGASLPGKENSNMAQLVVARYIIRIGFSLI